MRRNDGRTRLRRCANRLFSDVPLYSSPLRSLRTEKLIELACDATPSSPSSCDEVRIGAVVEDDEAGVDLLHLAVELDAVRVGVAADVAAGLVHGDVVRAVQAVRGHVAGDAGADDGDLHARAPRARRWSSRAVAGTSRRSHTMRSACSSFRP